MENIRILIVEDHQLVSKGIEMILENESDFAVFESASDIESAYEKAEKHQPDVVLLDLDLGKASGLDHIKGLKNGGSRHVLIITGSTNLDHHRKAIENGASGTVLKQEAGSTLIDAIRAVSNGEIWIAKSIGEKLIRGSLGMDSEDLEERMNRRRVASLTNREREIIEHLAHGMTNKEIASNLRLQEKTVRNSLTVIYSKLGVTRRLELALLAPKRGLDGKQQQ